MRKVDVEVGNSVYIKVEIKEIAEEGRSQGVGCWRYQPMGRLEQTLRWKER